VYYLAINTGLRGKVKFLTGGKGFLKAIARELPGTGDGSCENQEPTV